MSFCPSLVFSYYLCFSLQDIKLHCHILLNAAPFCSMGCIIKILWWVIASQIVTISLLTCVSSSQAAEYKALHQRGLTVSLLKKLQHPNVGSVIFFFNQYLMKDVFCLLRQLQASCQFGLHGLVVFLHAP